MKTFQPELCAFKAQNGHCNLSGNDAQNKSLAGYGSKPAKKVIQ